MGRAWAQAPWSSMAQTIMCRSAAQAPMAQAGKPCQHVDLVNSPGTVFSMLGRAWTGQPSPSRFSSQLTFNES